MRLSFRREGGEIVGVEVDMAAEPGDPEELLPEDARLISKVITELAKARTSALVMSARPRPDIGAMLRQLHQIGWSGMVHGRMAQMLSHLDYRQQEAYRRGTHFFQYSERAHTDMAVRSFAILVDEDNRALSLARLLDGIEGLAKDDMPSGVDPRRVRKEVRRCRHRLSDIRRKRSALVRYRNQQLAHRDLRHSMPRPNPAKEKQPKYSAVLRDREQQSSHRDPQHCAPQPDPAEEQQQVQFFADLLHSRVWHFTPQCVCDALESCREIVNFFSQLFGHAQLSWSFVGWDDWWHVERLIRLGLEFEGAGGASVSGKKGLRAKEM